MNENNNVVRRRWCLNFEFFVIVPAAFYFEVVNKHSCYFCAELNGS